MSRLSYSFRVRVFDITMWQVRETVTDISSNTLILIGILYCSTSGAVSTSTVGTNSKVKKVVRNLHRHL